MYKKKNLTFGQELWDTIRRDRPVYNAVDARSGNILPRFHFLRRVCRGLQSLVMSIFILLRSVDPVANSPSTDWPLRRSIISPFCGQNIRSTVARDCRRKFLTTNAVIIPLPLVQCFLNRPLDRRFYFSSRARHWRD